MSQPKTTPYTVEEFRKAIPDLEIGQPQKFRNQPNGKRLTVKPPGGGYCNIQLAATKADALRVPFGCSSYKGEENNAVERFSTSFVVPKGGALHCMLEELEEELLRRAANPENNAKWFQAWNERQRKGTDTSLQAMLKQPKPDANGEIKYEDPMFRVTVRPENVQVFVMSEDNRLRQVKVDPHLAITRGCLAIPIVSLSYIYVTSMWGVSWYLNSIIVIPNASSAPRGLNAFVGLPEGMELVEDDGAEPGHPSLADAPGGEAALQDNGPDSPGRAVMQPPMDTDDFY